MHYFFMGIFCSDQLILDSSDIQWHLSLSLSHKLTQEMGYSISYKQVLISDDSQWFWSTLSFSTIICEFKISTRRSIFMCASFSKYISNKIFESVSRELTYLLISVRNVYWLFAITESQEFNPSLPPSGLADDWKGWDW